MKNKKIEITDELLDEILDSEVDEDKINENKTIKENNKLKNSSENKNNIEEEYEYSLDELLKEDDELEEEEKNNEELYEENEIKQFDISKYLQENYSFKEIDKLTLEEYIIKELEKPIVQEIKKIYDNGLNIKNFPTFEELMKFKKEYNTIFIVEIGTPLEEDFFGIPQEFYICKTFRKQDYEKMLQTIGDFDEISISTFNDYIISNCVLFPELRIEDIPRLKYGVFDVLLPAIMKQSRFETSNRIIRL